MLPEPAPGEIFVVCVCYNRLGLPKWGPLLETVSVTETWSCWAAACGFA